jgi:hypothetical protein
MSPRPSSRNANPASHAQQQSPPFCQRRPPTCRRGPKKSGSSIAWGGSPGDYRAQPANRRCPSQLAPQLCPVTVRPTLDSRPIVDRNAWARLCCGSQVGLAHAVAWAMRPPNMSGRRSRLAPGSILRHACKSLLAISRRRPSPVFDANVAITVTAAETELNALLAWPQPQPVPRAFRRRCRRRAKASVPPGWGSPPARRLRASASAQGGDPTR